MPRRRAKPAGRNAKPAGQHTKPVGKKEGHRAPPQRKTQPGSGKLILFGRHAVIAAVSNPRRTIHALYAHERYHDVIGQARPTQTILSFAPDALTSLLPPGAVHQEICAHVAPLEQPAIETVLSDAADASDGPLIMLDQVTDPQNIGAIFRSCAAFGARAIIMQDKHAPRETGSLARAASGALEILPWIKVVNLARALETIAAAGYWTIGLTGHADTSLERVISSGQKLCLVFGAEGAGLRPNIAKHCDSLAKLDIDPRMESLNVSNAAAVALYAARRAA